MPDDTELLLRPDPAESPAARRKAPRGRPEMAPQTPSALAERPLAEDGDRARDGDGRADRERAKRTPAVERQERMRRRRLDDPRAVEVRHLFGRPPHCAVQGERGPLVGRYAPRGRGRCRRAGSGFDRLGRAARW